MSDDTKNVTRRNLLRALTIAGGAVAATQVLPKRWIRPVVDSVEIPVHAQASGSFTLGFSSPTSGATLPAGAYSFTVTTTPPTSGVTIGMTTTHPTIVRFTAPGFVPGSGVTNGSGQYTANYWLVNQNTLRQGTSNHSQPVPVDLTASANSGAVTYTVNFNYQPPS